MKYGSGLFRVKKDDISAAQDIFPGWGLFSLINGLLFFVITFLLKGKEIRRMQGERQRDLQGPPR